MINMEWGHPSYMRDYWRGTGSGTFIGFDSGIDYQLDSGNPNLIEVIRDLHESEGNAVTHGKHIVIGNGATQIIRAAISSYATLYVQHPYYSRFPVIANKEQLKFINTALGGEVTFGGVEIVTTPNNPTGERTKNVTNLPILYDLCYNWSQYGNVINEDRDMMVFSLSKATGHAGSRIGWGIFKEKRMADLVRNFIEIDTCGVSADSQIKAMSMILDQLRRPKNKRCFYFGRYELKYRWAKLKQALANYDNIQIKNRLGMFALIYMPDVENTAEHFMKAFDVQGTPGSAFGLDDSHLRLNIGCDTVDFDEFIKRLELNLKDY